MKSEVRFETALERLEQIVAGLEEGTLSLDEALKRYEEGVRLARLCTKQLVDAEKKIEVLTKSLNGECEVGPFELSDKDASSPEKEKTKGKKRSSGGRTGAGNLKETDLF